MWPCNISPPSGPVLVPLSFWLGVAVMVQFDHWDRGLYKCRAGGDVPSGQIHLLRILSTKTVLKEDL